MYCMHAYSSESNIRMHTYAYAISYECGQIRSIFLSIVEFFSWCNPWHWQDTPYILDIEKFDPDWSQLPVHMHPLELWTLERFRGFAHVFLECTYECTYNDSSTTTLGPIYLHMSYVTPSFRPNVTLSNYELLDFQLQRFNLFMCHGVTDQNVFFENNPEKVIYIQSSRYKHSVE